MDSISNRLELNKADLLNGETSTAGDAAVRVAIAETQIQAENKEYFLKYGIDLDSLNDKKKKRSQTMLLVKNLPFQASEEDIMKLFYGLKHHGEKPKKLLLPPS